MLRHLGCLILLAVLLAAPALYGQAPLPQPQASPKAVVTQTIGITDVTVSYHRPGVKGRVIWGGLVKYGEVWRGGANENTTVTFADPVKVNGKDLPAGTYGLHMIPNKTEWTVIFSKNATSWGSYTYDQKEDALRVTAAPADAPMQEWLEYQFDELTPSSATLSLRWEKLAVPVKLEFDANGIVLAYARNTYLRGSAGFQWQGWFNAANYCVQKGVNLDEASLWIAKSIGMNENTQNSLLKATILSKLGKNDEAATARDHAEAIACTEGDMNQVANAYLSAGNTKKGIDILAKNVKNHADSWGAHFNLAEGYAKAGDAKHAREHYEHALKLARDNDARERITAQMQKVKAE